MFTTTDELADFAAVLRGWRPPAGFAYLISVGFLPEPGGPVRHEVTAVLCYGRRVGSVTFRRAERPAVAYRLLQATAEGLVDACPERN